FSSLSMLRWLKHGFAQTRKPPRSPYTKATGNQRIISGTRITPFALTRQGHMSDTRSLLKFEERQWSKPAHGTCLKRYPRRRSHPLYRRPVLHEAAGRLRRRGHQDRKTRRRGRGANPPPFLRRSA